MQKTKRKEAHVNPRLTTPPNLLPNMQHESNSVVRNGGVCATKIGQNENLVKQLCSYRIVPFETANGILVTTRLTRKKRTEQRQ